MGAESTMECVRVDPHPAEDWLFAATLVVSLLLWFIIIFSVVGFIYGFFIAVFYFIIHTIFITYIRGSAVRLGDGQFPELYDRVVDIAERVGLDEMPAVYLLQAGGVLNAFATRFCCNNFIVLHSAMIEACANNPDALDFIIAHEAGHIKRGHLAWYRILLFPGKFIPFLGHAYSRSREYSCDCYGYALSKNSEKAIDGLCILAAGGHHYPQLSRKAYIDQVNELQGVWMKLGRWLSRYPPLAARVRRLDKTTEKRPLKKSLLSTVGAVLLACILVLAPVGAMLGLFIVPFVHAVSSGMQKAQALKAQQNPGAMPQAPSLPPPPSVSPSPYLQNPPASTNPFR